MEGHWGQHRHAPTTCRPPPCNPQSTQPPSPVPPAHIRPTQAPLGPTRQPAPCPTSNPRPSQPRAPPPSVQGDLILRPSFFELSLIHRGAATGDHLTGSYALSLAAVLRAQVVRLPLACRRCRRCCCIQYADLSDVAAASMGQPTLPHLSIFMTSPVLAMQWAASPLDCPEPHPLLPPCPSSPLLHPCSLSPASGCPGGRRASGSWQPAWTLVPRWCSTTATWPAWPARRGLHPPLRMWPMGRTASAACARSAAPAGGSEGGGPASRRQPGRCCQHSQLGRPPSSAGRKH